MKFYYFLTSTPGFIDAIARVVATKEDERFYEYGSGFIQIEDITDTTVGTNDCWLIKFSKVRADNYPAKTKLGQKGEDLVLDDDEFLSEETSAIISKDGSKFIVQYNHYGVRASAIRQCLNSLIVDPNNRVDLFPVLTSDAMEIYEKKKLTTSVVGCIEGITQADVALANGAGLSQALDASLEAAATTFRFEFSVDARIKSENIDRNFLEKIVDFISQRGGESDKLVVKVKEEEEDAVEAIDLLAHRKVTELDDSAIPRTAGRRYDHAHIYILLSQCFRDWK
jgi:hypothetical protein